MAAGRLGILLGIGKPDAEEESSPKDMACKALWKSIKRDDYEGFKSALADYLEYASDTDETEKTEDSPDEE